METEAYVLETDEETVVEVPTGHLKATRDLFEACKISRARARELLARRSEFSPAVVRKRADELSQIYESARARGVGGGAALERLEKRKGLAVYRDFLVLAVCRHGAFEVTHDPEVRGGELADAFRVEESVAPVLDRVDRELFRARISKGIGATLMDDEEWEEAVGGE